MGRIGAIDRELAREALKQTHGVVAEAARLIDVGRGTLAEALKTYLADVGEQAAKLREAGKVAERLGRTYTPEELAVIDDLGYRDAVNKLKLPVTAGTLCRQVRRQRAQERLAAAAQLTGDAPPAPPPIKKAVRKMAAALGLDDDRLKPRPPAKTKGRAKPQPKGQPKNDPRYTLLGGARVPAKPKPTRRKP
jgi:hypothetical protein